MDKKLQNLFDYCTGIYNGENGSELYNRYLNEIKSITPQELVYIQNKQLEKGLSADEVLTIVDKLMNVFFESLSNYKLNDPIDIPFIYYLNEENKALISILNKFKTTIKTQDLSTNNELEKLIIKVKEYNEHLLKLENVFFPYLEKRDERFNGLQILWALHDKTRDSIKIIENNLNNPDMIDEMNIMIGQLYFNLYGLVQKQELVLFPASTKFLSDYEFSEMHEQSFEYKFPFIESPVLEKTQTSTGTIEAFSNTFITETGKLNLEQLSLMLNALPLDISYVDENDEVAYFSKPEKRIFPRSKAAIGRNVRNCHPPKSVHIVEKILSSFKDGTKDVAEFWININDMMLLIKYICLRNEDGEYRGTLEIVQEISEIKSLEGEKRLLDWE